MKGIKTLSGHLTASNKRVLLIMLNRGAPSASTPKIRYYIDGGINHVYEVTMVYRESDDWGVIRDCKRVATFTVTP